MTERPREATEVHTRLLKCVLEIEGSRAFWAHTDDRVSPSPRLAFDEYWFGAKSLARAEVLLANMKVRYAAYPDALAVLHRWPHMSPEARRVVCHWHLQLADPLYRRFTGEFLPERRAGVRPEVTRSVVVSWVTAQEPERWTPRTRIEFASKLLSAAYSAGLVASNRDPRPLALPRVPNEALGYLLYLLRDIRITGSLLENPYLRSVGLFGEALEERLRSAPGIDFRRQADLVDFGWTFPDLRSWAEAFVTGPGERRAGGAP